jgi:hypothetical protein
MQLLVIITDESSGELCIYGCFKSHEGNTVEIEVENTLILHQDPPA